MKNKIILIVFILLIIAGLIILGIKRNNSSKSILGEDLKASDLSIDDFKWDMKPTTYNSEKCYEFTLTNNSEYDVIGVEIDYKVKQETSEEDLRVYSSFMGEHKDYIKESDSPKDVTLIGSANKLVKIGETIDGIRPTVGFKQWSWYSYPTEEQFDLMEPSELQLGIVGKNKKLYIAYYNFENNSWKLDENIVELNNWPQNDLSEKIKKPSCDYFVVRSSETSSNEINLKIYGVDKEFFNEYVKSIQEMGFAVDAPSDFNNYYTAKNTDGDSITIEFYDKEETISIYVHKN